MRFKIATSLAMTAALATLPQLCSASVAASQMVNLTGNTASSNYGKAIATGDFNNDGFMDTAVGTSSSSSTGSYVTVTYGSATNLSSMTVLPSNSSRISGTGTEADVFGASLAAGDTNGDGIDDLLVGATGDTTNGSGAGAVWLIPGNAAHFTSAPVNADLAHIKFTGGTNDGLGNAVAMGDLNNDGKAEMILGGSTGNGNAGNVYVLYGTTTAWTSTVAGAAAHGVFQGEIGGDHLGTSLAIGDINGDSYQDLVIGATGNDDGGSNAGSLYIMYGASADIVAGPTNVSTKPEFTGEAVGDGAGISVAVTSTSMNGDTYNDILVGATSNDDAVANAGAVYMVPGSATLYSGMASLGAATNLEFTGVSGGDQLGNAVSSGDFNQDGYSDAVLGDNTATSGTGVVYIINGGASVASGSVSTASTTFTGSTATAFSDGVHISGVGANSFGTAVAATDTNGDSFPELLVGATGYSSNTGAAFVGYLYIDADGDGVPGSTGLLATEDATTSSDCNDADATAAATSTYYADTDADTLGDPVAATTSVCSSTAPTGYVANALDTNDTIPNNGVEIGGDAVDNDGDTLIDEVNTVAENGAHPYYSLQAVTDTTTVATNITSVVGIAGGMIEVTYADNSVYDYPVYTSTSTKITNVNQYQGKGYGIVLHKKGKKVYLVNLYTSGITDKVTIKKAGFTSSAMLLKDLRSNNKDEVIVTGKTKAKVTLAVVKVSSANGTLTKSDSQKVTDKKVSVTKTKATSTKIKLRSAKSKTLEVFNVKKNYTLQLI